MKFASAQCVLHRSMTAFGLGCLLAFSSLPATAKDKQSRLPPLQLLTKSKEPSREAHREVLSSLYKQLASSPNAEAAQVIEGAIERLWSRSGSDTADLLMQRASSALKSRNYPLAKQLLKSITAIEPGYVMAWNQLATVYFVQEDYVSAMRQLRHVLAIDPQHYKAIEGLGIILREFGNKRSALKVVRRALAIHPHLQSAKQAEAELKREVEGQEI